VTNYNNVVFMALFTRDDVYKLRIISLVLDQNGNEFTLYRFDDNSTESYQTISFNVGGDAMVHIYHLVETFERSGYKTSITLPLTIGSDLIACA